MCNFLGQNAFHPAWRHDLLLAFILIAQCIRYFDKAQVKRFVSALFRSDLLLLLNEFILKQQIRRVAWKPRSLTNDEVQRLFVNRL